MEPVLILSVRNCTTTSIMDADYTELMRAAFTQSETLPLESRARIYRAASRLVPEARLSKELNSIAEALLELDGRCRAAKSTFLHLNP